jgi:hypothetical protein
LDFNVINDLNRTLGAAGDLDVIGGGLYRRNVSGDLHGAISFPASRDNTGQGDVAADGVNINLPGFDNIVFQHCMVNPGCDGGIIHDTVNRIFTDFL